MLFQDDTFRRMCHARELLSELSEDAPSVGEVARAVAISRFHFIRQFQALFGLTPHQLRIQARMNEAKLLLASGQHSVTAVCMAVGFSSLGTFSELFKRRVGVSPSAYQRRWRVMGQVPAQLARELGPGCLSLMGQLPSTAFRNFREA
jgi:AraC-like DNA-binding protein